MTDEENILFVILFLIKLFFPTVLHNTHIVKSVKSLVSVSHLAQVKDLLNDNTNGGRVCPLEGCLGLQVLEELQTLSGTSSAVLCQSCRV